MAGNNQSSAVPLTVAFVAGLIVGGGVTWVVTSPGDEGPIRVKSGSVELHLLNTARAWATDGDNRHWRISRGRRNHDDLEIYVNSGPGANCGPRGSGSTLTIDVGDNKTIEVKNQGRRLKITSRDTDLSVVNGILTYAGTEVFVRGIHLGSLNCTFTAKGQLLDFVIED